MRIVFNTGYKNAPSTELNISKLKLLNEIPNISIDFFREDYENYEVVLLMGYDHNVRLVKKQSPKALVGVIDPRPAMKNQLLLPDFIIANGIEMKDWYAQTCPNIFCYYIYPVLKPIQKVHQTRDKISLGYHGNKVHLEAMIPRTTDAIIRLNKEIKIELFIMYNIEQLGLWDDKVLTKDNVEVRHIQWKERNYERYMSKVDIGLIPNLMTIENQNLIKKKIQTQGRIFNEHESDYLIRFKPTSNSGRIFVFAQYGIPIIADMFPSALQTIDEDENGYICYSSHSWYNALKKLALNVDRRREMGQNLLNKFQQKYSPVVQNLKLIKFLEELETRLISDDKTYKR